MLTNKKRRKRVFRYCLKCDKKLSRTIIERGTEINKHRGGTSGWGCSSCRVIRPHPIICQPCCYICETNYKGEFIREECRLHRPEVKK